ncbi:ribonuclease III [Chloroflexota bacterium]
MATAVKRHLFDTVSPTVYAKRTATPHQKGTPILTDLLILQQTLMVSFNDPSLLEAALIHSSYVNENPNLGLASNERLEFLGDAVLGLIVAEKLYHDLPGCAEGEMTRIRAALIRQKTLFNIAEGINLGDYLYLGKGEESSGGRHKPLNLAGATEALIAAIFLDQGIAVAGELVLGLLDKELGEAINRGATHDYKSQLQHLIQLKQQQPPTYQVIKAKGPDHNRIFTVTVSAGNTVLGQGTGKSKKLAETSAARSALKNFPG